LLPGREVGVEQWRHDRVGRGVDYDDVGRKTLGVEGLEEPGDGRGVALVAGQRQRAGAGGPQRRGGGLQGVGLAAGYGDGGAALRQPTGNRQADGAAGTGDEGAAPGQVEWISHETTSASAVGRAWPIIATPAAFGKGGGGRKVSGNCWNGRGG